MAGDVKKLMAVPGPAPLGRRLESWKEIASYLNRHVTTVRRWEHQEGLPVHRHQHSRLGSVYAFARELDSWFDGRRFETTVEPDATIDGSLGSAPLPLPTSLTGTAARARLVGREAETEALANVWRAACERRPQFVMISGDAGIGKTRLVVDFARGLANQATVLVGGCEREALVPFAPFASIMQWLVRATPVHVLQKALDSIEGARELAQLAPDLQRRVRIAAEPVAASPEGRRFRMFDAYAQLVDVLASDHPALVVVEDVQWVDHGSALLLRHLVRSSPERAICIIATLRPNESLTADTREILEDLRRDRATSLTLTGLDERDVRILMKATAGRDLPGWAAPFVVRHTEGNPFFVIELVRHLDDAGWLSRLDGLDPSLGWPNAPLPDGAREVIERRFSRLSGATRSLLTIGAVVGRHFQLSTLEAIGGLGEDAVLDAMDEALAARIIVEEPAAPGSFAFTHALIREALYSSISAARRVRLHYRIATALEHASSASTVPHRELAYHFGRAASYKGAIEAVAHAIRAGDDAAASLAFEDAAHCYAIALRALEFLPPASDHRAQRVDMQVKRGRCLFQVGQWAPARTAFEAALALLPDEEPEKRCELLVSLAEATFWMMELPALRRYASEAQELSDRIGREDLWADARAWAASAMVSDGDVEGGVNADRQTLARVGGIRSFGMARMPLTLYWVGRTNEAINHATSAVACARTRGEPAFLLYALQHLGLSLSGAGRYDEAISAFDEARAFGRQCGALPLLARATSMSVAPLMSLDDLAGAKTRALEARDLAHQVGFEPPFVSAGLDLLLIFARTGDPGSAEGLLAEVAEATRKATGWHAWKWNMRLAQARAELALARSDWAEAEAAATLVIDQSRPRRRPKYEALGLAVRATARKELGSRLAFADARASVQVARALGDPAVLRTCLRTIEDVGGLSLPEDDPS